MIKNMIEKTENPYALWLNQARFLSTPVKKALASRLKGARNVYRADPMQLASANLLSEKELDDLIELQKESRPEDLAMELEKEEISFVSVEERTYPKRLREVIDHPYGLYYRGRLVNPEARAASIVGARRCSAYGYSTAKEIGYLLGRTGFTVVSGMARGIDSAGQEGCLEAGGRTVAVLGSGVDVIYPPENKNLYQRILEQGCVLSEFAPGTPPIGKHFPQRNRIISGLSDHVIVVEARIRSGSLITAQMACQQNRNLLVVPGRINDPMSQGTNHLIEMGATIIPSEERLIEKLSEEAGMPLHLLPEKKVSLTMREKCLYQCMDYYAKSGEKLLAESGLSFRDFLEVIHLLSQKGLIREVNRQHYVKV
ncbi:MAG: DNA-processing protein DprA [Lachnospiraceae bacterium]|nr:DNA-processing protein DprA [Lachnospiraceae bacterium]